MNLNLSMEDTILHSIFYSSEYFSKTFGNLKPSHFENTENSIIFNEIKSYVLENDKRPSLREIAIKIKNSSSLTQELKTNTLKRLFDFSKEPEIENTDFLLKETEFYLKKTQLTQAIYDSVEILNSKKEFNTIIDKITDALNVNFDLTEGLDYSNTIETRVEYYHKKLNGISSGIKPVDWILNGGFMDKTLNLFLSPSGGGKSAALVSIGANMLTKGKNILYITLEMSENEIGKRFDANILDYETKDLKEASTTDITKAFNNIKHTLGKLYIKEYPAGAFNTLQLKALVEEYRNIKGVLFDVILIDYLTLMSSYRTTLSKSSGTYGLYKSISEELHGFAKTCEANGRVGIPIITASQLRREAFNNLDVGLDSISDSIGIIQTSDVVIGILSTEQLRERKESVWKFMKNRNSGILKDITLKTDFSKMRFSESEIESNGSLAELNEVKDSEDKAIDFSGFKF